MKKGNNDVKTLRVGALGRWGLEAALCVAIIATAGVGAAKAASLEDAVRSAVNTNPDVGVVAKDRLAVDQELQQGKALYYPSLDAAQTMGFDDTVQKANALPGSTGTLFKDDKSIILSQTLFDGFFAASEVQRQKARVDSAALRVVATSEAVGLDATQAYLDVLREQELVALAEDNQKTHERYLEDMKARLRGGTGSMADVRQAESRLARAIATVAEEKGKEQDAETSYIKSVGETPDGLSKPGSVEDQMPATVDMAVAMAIESSPPVQVANADIQVSQAELRQSRSDYYPTFKLQLGELWNRNDSGVKGKNRDEQALVVMNWNLFRGGGTVAKNEEFVQRLAESREVLGQTERKAEQETRLSWSALQSARDRHTAIATQVKANEKVRDAYTQQFNLGQRSLLDVLDSENELFVSRGDLLAAEYIQLFAGYRMLAVEGQLLKQLGVNHPKEGMTHDMADAEQGKGAVTEATETSTPAPADAATDATAPAAAAPAAADATVAPAASADQNAAPPANGQAQPATDNGQPAAAPQAPATAPQASDTAAPAASDKQAEEAPSEGFKQAGQVSDDGAMQMNFNPVWNVE
jgi:adhesin transport system outer membrane protein